MQYASEDFRIFFHMKSFEVQWNSAWVTSPNYHQANVSLATQEEADQDFLFSLKEAFGKAEYQTSWFSQITVFIHFHWYLAV